MSNYFSTEHMETQLNDLLRTIDADTGYGKVEIIVREKRIHKIEATATSAPGVVSRTITRRPRK